MKERGTLRHTPKRRVWIKLPVQGGFVWTRGEHRCKPPRPSQIALDVGDMFVCERCDRRFVLVEDDRQRWQPEGA